MKSRRNIKQSNTDTLFKLPVPIPEPPRMVNIKPSVPDLSIDYDLPTKTSSRSEHKDSFAELSLLLKRQEEKMDKMTKQLQMILSLQTKKEPEKRSVGTMTSFHTKSRRDKSSTHRKMSERYKKKKASDSGLLTSESESRSDRSELPRSRSKVKEDFYEKFLQNLNSSTENQRISNSRSEQSESHSSPSPSRDDRNRPSSKANFEADIISKLAEKYLKKDRSDVKSNRQDLLKKPSLSEGEDYNLRRGKGTSRRKHTTVSDFTEEASIGVVNYFEKYGLLDE